MEKTKGGKLKYIAAIVILVIIVAAVFAFLAEEPGLIIQFINSYYFKVGGSYPAANYTINIPGAPIDVFYLKAGQSHFLGVSFAPGFAALNSTNGKYLRLVSVNSSSVDIYFFNKCQPFPSESCQNGYSNSSFESMNQNGLTDQISLGCGSNLRLLSINQSGNFAVFELYENVSVSCL